LRELISKAFSPPTERVAVKGEAVTTRVFGVSSLPNWRGEKGELNHGKREKRDWTRVVRKRTYGNRKTIG
jgi:hypothetical protein